MEYLVTMTTRVPDGTPAHEVDGIRAREAAHTRDLAAQGQVLRLWRPPLEPGEWRTIGLFAAEDAGDLERVLASMPLRVWRTDAVTALGAHPDDPGPGKVPFAEGDEEYLVTSVVGVPAGTSPEAVDERFAREAGRARELAADGYLVRLWKLPGEGRNLGLWQVTGATRLREILRSLPLGDWLGAETVSLTRHPSDPVTAGATP